MNWFAIGGGLAVALVGALPELARLRGRPASLPRTTAIILILLGLALAAWGAGPIFEN